MNNEEELVTALYVVKYELHPVYGSTAGRYGGIGGQAMTPHCALNYPDRHDLKDIEASDWADTVLRDSLNRLDGTPFDLHMEVARLLPKERRIR